MQINSKLKHNGNTPGKADEMSHTGARLAVLRKMDLIHPKIPALVQRTFAYDLQRATLKDLQPQICDSLDSFLEDITEEDARVDRATARQAKQIMRDSDTSDEEEVTAAYFRPESNLQRKVHSNREENLQSNV